MELFLFWIACAIAGAAVGGRVNSAGTGFILGLILGPLGLIIAFTLKGDRRKCPFCAELVKPEAKVCPHCQRDIPQTAT